MSERRVTNKNFAPLSAVIERLLQQYRPPNDQPLLKVWDIWELAVGQAIAANARPVAFKGDMLLVHVLSSTWLHHIRFLEKEMIAKINKALGEGKVRTIKLKVGSF